MSDSNEPAKIGSRFWIWLGVAALVVTVGVFFLASSADSSDTKSRERPATSQTTPRPATTTKTPTPVRELPTVLSGDVAIEMQVEDRDDQAVVVGTTNLPDKTALTVIVEDTPTGGADFRWSMRCAVREGTFEAGPLKSNGRGPLGEHRVTVRMPIPRLQPPSVQERIGREGEYLAGPLVREGNAATGDKVVEQSHAYILGGEAGVEEHRSYLYALQVKGRILADRLESLGFELAEAARGDREVGRWSTYLRTFQQRARRVRKDAEDFPRTEIRKPLVRGAEELGHWALEHTRYEPGTQPPAMSRLVTAREAFREQHHKAREALKALSAE